MQVEEKEYLKKIGLLLFAILMIVVFFLINFQVVSAQVAEDPEDGSVYELLEMGYDPLEPFLYTSTHGIHRNQYFTTWQLLEQYRTDSIYWSFQEHDYNSNTWEHTSFNDVYSHTIHIRKFWTSGPDLIGYRLEYKPKGTTTFTSLLEFGVESWSGITPSGSEVAPLKLNVIIKDSKLKMWCDINKDFDYSTDLSFEKVNNTDTDMILRRVYVPSNIGHALYTKSGGNIPPHLKYDSYQVVVVHGTVQHKYSLIHSNMFEATVMTARTFEGSGVEKGVPGVFKWTPKMKNFFWMDITQRNTQWLTGHVYTHLNFYQADWFTEHPYNSRLELVFFPDDMHTYRPVQFYIDWSDDTWAYTDVSIFDSWDEDYGHDPDQIGLDETDPVHEDFDWDYWKDLLDPVPEPGFTHWGEYEDDPTMTSISRNISEIGEMMRIKAPIAYVFSFLTLLERFGSELDDEDLTFDMPFYLADQQDANIEMDFTPGYMSDVFSTIRLISGWAIYGFLILFFYQEYRRFTSE